MAIQNYDIIVAGDFRHTPCSRTTLADQLQALIEGGYRTGILQLTGALSDHPESLHASIRRMIDDGRIAKLDPDLALSARLMIAADPELFIHRPRRPLRVEADHRLVLVAEAPASFGQIDQARWAAISSHVREMFGEDCRFAPMSPAARAQLLLCDPRPALTDADWHDCVDLDAWRPHGGNPGGPRPRIGGASAHPDDWPHDPNEILLLFPDDSRFLVKIRGADAALRERLGAYPRNWELLHAEETGEADFLASIDVFVHCHHPSRTDPLHPLLLKAMASGVVPVLPTSYHPIFGDGAIYARPDEVGATVLDLHADHAHYRRASEAARTCVEERFGPSTLVGLVDGLIGPPARETIADAAPSRHRRRVMFVTINGIGMGHLTRMLAIARRCPDPIEPVFVTMSQALKVLRQQGYLAEFIPSRKYLGADVATWNGFVKDELGEMLSFYDPAVVVFDGNVPYQGVIEAIKANADPWSIWSRRGMWRSESLDIIKRERHFDVVLEPGDLAAPDDHGITSRHRTRTHRVDPIRLLDAGEMLPREQARLELGLDPDRTTALIQLGAGNNFDFRSIHKIAFEHLTKRYDVQIAVGEWLISERPIDLPDSAVRMPDYPFARFFNAFDLAVSAVGYNSFHELLYAGVPTILVPNEATEQDNQLARALYADRLGLGICVRSTETYALTAAIDRLFDLAERERMGSNLKALDPANGAQQAATLIEELAYSRRIDRPA